MIKLYHTDNGDRYTGKGNAIQQSEELSPPRKIYYVTNGK